jgi:hypothetical protein
MTVLWDVAPCSAAEIDRRFRRVYCLHRQDDVMEAVSTSDMRLHGATSQKAVIFVRYFGWHSVMLS